MQIEVDDEVIQERKKIEEERGKLLHKILRSTKGDGGNKEALLFQNESNGCCF